MLVRRVRHRLPVSLPCRIVKRSGPIARRTPMNWKASTKNREFAAELDAVTPALEARSGGWCELGISGVCGTGMAGLHRHHRRRRSQGGTNDLSNLIHLCDGCHTYVHAHPAISYSRGWLLHGV
jgi:hypothetical protein